MSLTNPRAPEAPRRRLDIYILVLLLGAVALLRSSNTSEPIRPTPANGTPERGSAGSLPSPAQSAPPAAVQIDSKQDGSASAPVASQNESRPKLQEPGERASTSQSLSTLTLTEVRFSSIADQGRVERLIGTLRSTGLDESEALIQSIAAGDQIVTIGLALAMRSMNEPLPAGFDGKMSMLIAFAPPDIRLGAIEAAGIVGRPFPKTLESLRRAATDGNARIQYRALGALKRIEES